MTLLYIYFGGLFIFLVLKSFYDLYVALMVYRGVYPKKGSASMADVERLVEQGRYLLAKRCYRRLTNMSLKDSVSAVENMRKEKNRNK